MNTKYIKRYNQKKLIASNHENKYNYCFRNQDNILFIFHKLYKLEKHYHPILDENILRVP